MPTPELIQTAYDRGAATYDDRFEPLQRPKYAALLGPTGERLSGVASCLDAGCGTGLLGAFLREHDRAPELLVGVDLSREMLLRARARGVIGVQADLVGLPFADGAFDAVVSVTALGLVAGQRERALAELARVLAPGGLMAVSVLEEHANRAFTQALRGSGVRIEEVLPCGAQDIGYVGRRTP